MNIRGIHPWRNDVFTLRKLALMTREDNIMPTPHHPTAAVRRTLLKLGQDIKAARLRRRLPMTIIAERAFTSRATLQRIEKGDHGVSIGIYAAALNALGLLDGLGQIADISNDSVGQALSEFDLPQRARIRAPKRPKMGHEA